MAFWKASKNKWLPAVFAAVAAGLLSVPLWGRAGLMNSLTEFLCLLALAQLWNLLAGYAGLVSVGQQAWIGLGGYALLVLVDDLHVPVLPAVALAGLAAALLAYPTARLMFRLRGGYFAIGTWVTAEVFRLLIMSSTGWLGGGLGRSLDAARLIRPPQLRIALVYLLAVAVCLGSIALVYFLVRSRTGLGLTAIRDSEGGAAGLGVDTRRLKLFVYVVCAAGTAVAGSVICLNALQVVPKAAFSVNWSAFMIFIVVIGGIGSVEGPIVGALVFFLVREYLSDFAEWSFILLGVVAVAVMLLAPKGLWGLVRDRFQWELFPVRRRLPKVIL